MKKILLAAFTIFTMGIAFAQNVSTSQIRLLDVEDMKRRILLARAEVVKEEENLARLEAEYNAVLNEYLQKKTEMAPIEHEEIQPKENPDENTFSEIMNSLKEQADASDRTKVDAIKVRVDASRDKAAALRDSVIPLEQTLRQLYNALENQTYQLSTRSPQLKLNLGEYNTQKACWNLELDYTLTTKQEVYKINLELPYQSVTGKYYDGLEKMSEKQREDYEYNVQYYDDLFRLETGTGSVLHAELTYKITPWKKASEYRFEPSLITVFKTERRTDQIMELSEEDLEPVVFTLTPAVEVRTPEEALDWVNRIERIEYEEKYAKNRNFADESAKLDEEARKRNVEQKGRRTFTISVDTEQDDITFRDYDILSQPISNVAGALTWGVGKFAFTGIDFGYDALSYGHVAVFNLGLEAGLNVNIKNILRPYLIGKAGIGLDNTVYASVGAGLDITLGHFLITGGYNYLWNFGISSLLDDSIDTGFNDITTTKKHVVFLGVGVTW